MNGYYQRKFHMEVPLSDGNICRLMVNIEADTEEELYDKSEIRGSFWFEKIAEGWLGEFELDEGLVADQRAEPFNFNDLVFNGVYRGESAPVVPITSTAAAEAMLARTYPLHYETIPRTSGRLEDFIESQETHFWGYKKEIPKKEAGFER